MDKLGAGLHNRTYTKAWYQISDRVQRTIDNQVRQELRTPLWDVLWVEVFDNVWSQEDE